MKRKIVFLIVGCIFTVVALAAIQGYFIYNTYALKEKEINAEVKKQLFELEDTPEYTALDDEWMEKAAGFLKDYKDKTINREAYNNLITQTTDSLSAVLHQFMQTQEIYQKYKIGYAIYMTSATVTQNGKTDTIFNGKIRTLGNTVKSKNEISFASGKWQTSSIKREELSNKKSLEDYSLEIRTQRYYSIENWEKIVMGKMIGLLLFSLLLLSFVVGLFYLSIKNLITEKKISSVKTDFINNITHEFQTPLATIDIAIKTLQQKEKQLSPEHHQNTLSIIKRQNERLQKLFIQITEASFASEIVAFKQEKTVMSNEIDAIIYDFQISKPNITIQHITSAENVLLKIEHFHLNTIIVNLLDNAVKYGAQHIETTLTISENHFTFSIKDDGRGISEKHHKLIFEKFYRIEKGNIHTTKGLGLGLFYVKQLIIAYGGSITVKSEAGKGALFSISIPLS